jgi:O-acetyl-ADP-ribose deacetylase
MRVEIVEGDITGESVEAVVNAANSSLLGGGGVDGAIHRRGGPVILEACRRLRSERYPNGLPTGHAVATPGGNLLARWVIHTVGPIYASSPEPAHDLAACHVSSLAVADELGARTVAFPAISTGVYGYPMHEAAQVAIRAVLGATTAVQHVRFVLYGKDARAVFVAAWERLQA